MKSAVNRLGAMRFEAHRWLGMPTLVVVFLSGQFLAAEVPGKINQVLNRSATKATATTLPPKQAAVACQSTAEELLRHGHRVAAIGLFERARQLDAKRTKVARQLAVLYDQEGMDSKALEEYRRALHESPKDPDLLNDLGYFYLVRGDLTQAEKWFKAALSKQQQHQTAKGNLALTMAEQGRYTEAYEIFAGLSGPAIAHSNLGMVLARHGDYEQAKQSLRQALDLDGQIQQAKVTLAYLEDHFPAVSPP
jgi:Flp pilus assembly protein TadD